MDRVRRRLKRLANAARFARWWQVTWLAKSPRSSRAEICCTNPTLRFGEGGVRLAERSSGATCIRLFSAGGWRGFASDTGNESLLNAIKTASMQHSGDDGSRSLNITEAHVAAGDVAVNRHFWNERDADTGRNHSQQTAELPAFKYNVRRDACARAGVNTQITETVAVAQHHERFSAQVFEGERFCSGARMIFAQCRIERLGSDGEQLQVLVA